MTESGLAPQVRSILAAARDRDAAGGERPSVTARPLEKAIARAEADDRVPIIAEVKPTSPTTDGVRADDPVELAREMVAGGAAAISVLTEPEHFGGSIDALERVRAAVDVPVLRKDFLLRESHLDAVGADLVLIIARFVDDLAGLVEAARSRGFQPLVEVHDRNEFHAALETGAEIVGINNRDLTSLEVDLGTFERVAGPIADGPERTGEPPDARTDRARQPSAVTVVAESGISTPADVRRMRAAGADALLVGSAVMDGDVEPNTRALVTAGRSAAGPTPGAPEVDTS